MKAIGRSLSLVAISLLLCSCAVNLPFTAVPVKGPAAVGGTALKGSFTYNGTGHGTMTVTGPTGEICTGPYSTVANGVIGHYQGSVFGSGLWSQHHSGSISTVSRKQAGQGILVGDKGTTFTVEYLVSGRHGFGLGKDNRGNLYRVIF